MMELLDHLEPVIDLTGQDNMIGLTYCLIKALNRNIEANSIAYYELYKLDEEEHIIVNPLDPQKKRMQIQSIKGLNECLTIGDVVSFCFKESENIRNVYPIFACQDILAFLVVDRSFFIQKEHNYVLKLLRVYENLCLLLSKKERDTLTGLLNRQAFDERINQVLLFYRSSFQRNSDRVNQACLAVLDIDHFKKVNDTYGHLIGDEVLLNFAKLMDKCFRFTDFLFRFGGEEFVVLLNEISEDNAFLTLERFRQSVEENPFPLVDRVTVSVGFTLINEVDMPTTLIEKADKALYYAKNSGRNKVCSYDILIKNGSLEDKGFDSDDIELWG